MEFTCYSARNLLPVFFLELLHGLHTWLLLCVASEDTPVGSSEGADITCVHMFRWTTPSILCAYSFDSMVDQRTSFPQLIMCFSRKVPPSSEEQTLHAVQAPPFPWSSHDRKLVSGADNSQWRSDSGKPSPHRLENETTPNICSRNKKTYWRSGAHLFTGEGFSSLQEKSKKRILISEAA